MKKNKLPKYLKTKRALKREIQRRFIEAWKVQCLAIEHAEEQKILYGAPTGQKPEGIIHAIPQKD